LPTKKDRRSKQTLNNVTGTTILIIAEAMAPVVVLSFLRGHEFPNAA
jgi:hypothetical protein